MSNALHYLGITHRTAPLALRERVQCDALRLRRLLNALGTTASERLVLSTCERFEVYTNGEGPRRSRLRTVLAQFFDLPLCLFSRHECTIGGGAAAEHLLRVAAGLESRIVGEPHILGQVRQAYDLALNGNALGPVLSALTRAAIHTGKRVRSETGINSEARSIATIASDRLEEDFALLQDRTVLVLGTGRLALDVSVQLAARRATVLVAGRNRERAALLAAKVGGEALVLDALPDVLDRADALVACTAAGDYLITPAMLKHRTGGRLRIWDLCVPRNIDPVVATLPDITLEHLEDLVSTGPLACLDLTASERIVQEELARFARWHRERAAAPFVAQLVDRAHRVRSCGGAYDGRALHRRIMAIKRGIAA